MKEKLTRDQMIAVLALNNGFTPRVPREYELHVLRMGSYTNAELRNQVKHLPADKVRLLVKEVKDFLAKQRTVISLPPTEIDLTSAQQSTSV